MGEEVAKCSKGPGAGIGFAMSCSVCLEAVIEDAGERSIAKLKCGHHFHLDCIGSAFNAKGRMQCPNCRQVEHGQWLFASGCYLQHDDFVDDFTFEEEVEAFGGAANLHYAPAPWCPHQGSYAQFSLTVEELDNIASGLVIADVDPVINVRPGSRVSTSTGQLCPYLAAQGFSLGGSSQEFLGLHVGHHRPSRSIRRAASFHRSFGQPQTSATTISTPPSYEGSSQSYNPVGGLLQSSSNRLHTLGFLVGSPQSVHTGVSQGMGMASRPIISQPPHVRSTQSVTAVSRPQSISGSRSGGTWRNRHHEMPSTPQRTSQQGPSTEVAWTTSEPTHEFNPLVASSIGQGSSPVVVGGEVGWAPAAESQMEGWASGVFVPQPSMGSSSQWWAWVPSGSTHGNHQRLVAAGGAPTNTYQHESQFIGPGVFPARPSATPMVGFSEQPSEGPYAWGFAGFQ